MRCPLCKKKYYSALDHLKEHGIICKDNTEAEEIINFFRFFVNHNISVPIKHFNNYTFEEFLEVLDKVDTIPEYEDYFKIRKALEPLMVSIAKRFADKCLEVLPKIAKSQGKWSKYLAIETLIAIRSDKVIPKLIDFINVYEYEIGEAILDLFTWFKEESIECIKRALLEEKRFDLLPRLLEVLYELDKTKAASITIEFINKLDDIEFEGLIDKLEDLLIYIMEVFEDEINEKWIRDVIIVLGNAVFLKTREKILNFHDVIKAYKQEDVIRKLYLLSEIIHNIEDFIQESLILEEIKKENLEEIFESPKIRKIVAAFEKWAHRRQILKELSLKDYEDIAQKIISFRARIIFYFLVANMNISCGMFSTAEALIDKILSQEEELSPTELAKAMSGKAFIHELKLDFENAEKLYLEAIEFEKDSDIIADYVNMLLLAGKIDKAKKYLNELKEDVMYHRLLKAYYIYKSGCPMNNDEQKLYTEVTNYLEEFAEADIETFFKVYNTFLRLCNHAYEYAWKIVEDNEKLQQELLDTLSLACKIHFDNFIDFIYQLEPNNPIVNFFMGVKALREDKPREAIQHFAKALKSKLIDKEVLYVNILLALLSIRNKELSQKIANNLIKLLKQGKIKDPHVTHCALAHYYLFIKDYEKARFHAKRLKNVDRETYRHLMKHIRKKTFSLDDYLYFVVTRANITEKECPLLLIHE